MKHERSRFDEAVRFFMPEQKKKEAEIEDMKVKKPLLNEGKMQEINDLLVQSVQDELEIVLVLWMDKLHVQYTSRIQIFRLDSIIGAKIPK